MPLEPLDEPIARGRSRASIALATILLLLVGAAPLASCTGDKNASARPKATGAGPPGAGMKINRAVVVEATTVKPRALKVAGEYNGQVIAAETAEIAAQVSGRVVEVRGRLGEAVKKDDVLVRIDAVPYRQQLRQAEGAVLSARAAIRVAEVQRDNLDREVKRQRPLVKDRLTPRATLDELEAQHRAAVEQVDVARAALKQSQASMDAARDNLRRTTLRAPISGVISSRSVEPGRQAMSGASLMTIVQTDDLILRVALPEQDIARVRVGGEVQVILSALPQQPCTGTFARLAPTLDPTTRTLTAEVALDKKCVRAEDGATLARPGMFARARAELGEAADALVIPRQAVFERDNGKMFVWVIRDGKAHQQDVTLGLRDARDVQIAEGLRDGDQVVLRGVEKLRPGAAVVSPQLNIGRLDEAAPDKAASTDKAAPKRGAP